MKLFQLFFLLTLSIVLARDSNKCEVLIIYYKNDDCTSPRYSNPYLRQTYKMNSCVEWKPEKKLKREQWIIVTECTSNYTFYRCYDQWTPNYKGEKAQSTSGTCHKTDDGSSYRVWLNEDAIYFTWGFFAVLMSIFLLCLGCVFYLVTKRWNR